MSKAQRIEIRENYMQAWYPMDIHRLLASTAPDFIFDDPAEAEPVSRTALPDVSRAGFQRRSRAIQRQKLSSDASDAAT
jgi:hypothetical protein